MNKHELSYNGWKFDICRLSYASCSAYSGKQAVDLPVLTGSSLNYQKKQHDQKEKDQAIETTPPDQGKTDPGTLRRNRRKNKVWRLGTPENPQQRIERLRLLRDRKQTLSFRSKNKIKQKALGLFRAGRCKTFVTLTFINKVDDRIAQKCLQDYIRNWRKDYGQQLNYIYVAERQRNGNVHFHILTSNKFFDIKKENNRWVRVQYNNGLKFFYKGQPVPRADIEAMIDQDYLSDILNPFDVNAVYDRHGVVNYVSRYVTKKKNVDEFFDFRPWGCSQRVSKLYTGILAPIETIRRALGKDNCRIQKTDYFKNGKLLFKKGQRHEPKKIFGAFANTVKIYNDAIVNDVYKRLDELNYDILVNGARPDPGRMSIADYYLKNAIPTEPVLIVKKEEVQYDFSKWKDHKQVLYYDEKKILRCADVEGKVPIGKYKLKNGNILDAYPWSDDELKFMERASTEERLRQQIYT